MSSSADTAEMASAVRFLAADMVNAANSGHPGLPLGMADVATVLWSEFYKFDATDPNWADRDRFVLSAGHGSALLYALGWLSGLDGVELDHLKAFRQLGSPAAGHPEFGHFPGVETTTGPLGQGLANAVGMAIAEAKLRAEFGPDLCDHRTWVLAGDGCLMEGIAQEALSLAGHLNLSRLTVLWDDNRITIDGATSLSTSDDQLRRFEASGWSTLRVDGHDPGQVADALRAATASDRPTLIACGTVIGRGAPNKAGSSGIHGSPLGPDERAAMAAELDWPYQPFHVPDTVLGSWRAVGRRGAAQRAAWVERSSAPTETATAFRERLAYPVGAKSFADLADLRATVVDDTASVATRVASQRAIAQLIPDTPGLLGGSADLSGSNGARSDDHVAFTAENRTGNYINYGIREHAMAAAMNGIALHGGHVAYGSTFLVFSDYSRPAIRLAALMELPVIHIMTHDSIGVGEDGPTHQPVEHVCALRSIPNLLVIRPADALETVDAWTVALSQQNRPTVLVLSRQGLAPIERPASGLPEPSTVARGGYRVAGDGAGQVTLLGSGSEVGVALAARELLALAGVAADVVSMPSLELFAEQPEDYRRDILGAGPRVVVEASVAQAWGAFIDRGDRVVAMAGFGASGPASELFRHFGITPDAVAERALEIIDQTLIDQTIIDATETVQLGAN